MTWSKSGFSEHYSQIRIEGFDPGKLIDWCMRERVQLRNVTVVSELEITARIAKKDVKRLKKLAGHTYKITAVRDGGYGYMLGRLRRKKITLAGLLLFAAFFVYQSLFVVEIRVSGYESIDEPRLRQTMAQAGLYEGCRKTVDLNRVKLKLFDEYDQITWVGIHFTGGLAEVSIAEGEEPLPEKTGPKKPCSIVADQAGYIDEIDPVEGQRAAEDGDYVKKGDVLISGVIPLQNADYGTESEEQTETYVHAEGTVKARIPKRLNFYAERYWRQRQKTGRTVRGISVNGHDLVRNRNTFEAAQIERKNILDLTRPFRLRIDTVSIAEVRLTEREVKDEELQKMVGREIRRYAKENLPEKAQILNKSLNFSREKNIITIGVTLETLQQIGTEEEIIVDRAKGKRKEDQHQSGN